LITSVAPADAALIARTLDLMRPAERAELGGDDVVAQAVSRSQHTFCGLVDGSPAFLGGICEGGLIWMVSTPLVDRAKKFFLRETRRQIDLMQAMEPVLFCWVDVRYPKSLRWLEWLGFSSGELVVIPSLGVTARKMERHA
jgi:hypothetical protein